MTINLPFILEQVLNHQASPEQDILVLLSTEEEATRYYHSVKFFCPGKEVLFLPSFDSLPYDRLSPSQKISTARARSLVKLLIQRKSIVLVTAVQNLFNKLPPKDYLSNCYIELKKGQAFNQTDFESFLIKNNYTKTAVAIDAGDYSRRGDIIDIVTDEDIGYRINFEWDAILSIKLFNTHSQISFNTIDCVEIFTASEVKLNESSIQNFRNAYLTTFGISKMNEVFFEQISSSVRPSGIESLAPIFYDKSINLVSYLNNPKTYTSPFALSAINEYDVDIKDLYHTRISSANFFPAFEPSTLYFSKNEVLSIIDQSVKIDYEAKDQIVKTQKDFLAHEAGRSEEDMLQLFLDFVMQNHEDTIIVTCANNYHQSRFVSLLSQKDTAHLIINKIADAKKGLINICILDARESFRLGNFIIIPDTQICGKKNNANIKSNKKKLKNILKEYENFFENDLVVHKEHGIGRYQGIEHVTVDNIRHDCLKIIYNKGDKLFIPVENSDDIKKFGDGEVELDNLGGTAWQRRKAKLKERVGQIAASLIEIAAKRHLVRLEPIEYDMESYTRFCDAFPYIETEDQDRACTDILHDLNSERPMDRLVCGDVGFGKTEVAMRAAFLVSQNKQVAMMVSTTILARQHYLNFIERFKGFDVSIKQISRFVSQKEIEVIKEEIKNGSIDIIIGTHSLLSDSIGFKDLGLLIIDEEQHFGVLQKEKLKKLRGSVHSLTLSATPIPRTLQYSLVGIKDLSLIATPPLDRLSVKTNIINFDNVVLRDALLRERSRGGKSFVVAPRVSDLPVLSDALKIIAPELSFKIIHGKLAPGTIDKIMQEFYDGKLDILLSTAIVESGLDIPSANTMVIYKADMFGLSQLYQLRGRVGRRKIRGYTYLILDEKKSPTKNAKKRLEVIQSIDSLGAGFSIASSDMDIRGFGNMVGDEQSGHVKEVGVELYQEMLEETINRLKDVEHKEPIKRCEIKINIPIFIPDEYISDSTTRLAIYRRAGEIETELEIEEFCIELIDRFGPIPESTKNLIDIIRIRLKSTAIYIKTLDVGPSGVIVKFREDVNHDSIMKFIAKYPRNTKIKPENKLIFLRKIHQGSELLETKNLLEILQENF